MNSYGRYSVPTELANGSGETFYPVSDVSRDVYTHSMVIGGNGRTVYSHPGAMEHTTNVLRVGQQQSMTGYSEEQLSMPHTSGSTLVIPEDSYQLYNSALSNSNAAMTLESPLTGGSRDIFMEDLPNESCKSFGRDRLPSQQSLSSDPFSNDMFSLGVPLAMSVSEMSGHASDMETALDNDILRLIDPFLPQIEPVAVIEDETFIDLLRKLEEPAFSEASSNLVSPPGPEAFQTLDSNILSSTIYGDDMGEPIQAQPHRQVASPSFDSQNQKRSIEDDFALIKMLNPRNKKTSPPKYLGVQIKQEPDSNISVCSSELSSVISESDSFNQVGSVIPALDSSPHPSFLQAPVTPVQVSTATSPAPSTPMTPSTPYPPTKKGPFQISCNCDGVSRICEVGISDDLPNEQRQMAYSANAYSWDLCKQYSECMNKPFDMGMASTSRAELCKFDFDRTCGKLRFTMPKECMHLDKWLQLHEKDIDLRDRKLVVQQVVNLLATIHTAGSADKLCLWGSFVVWVAPTKQVYVLIDYPEMLVKMERQSCLGPVAFDARVEDVKALYGLYTKVFQPVINQNGSWVSPNVKELLTNFETLITDPSSVCRMAELARTLGVRRLCKLEVEIMTIPHHVYCVEHEPLFKVLSHVESMLPPVACHGWNVLWTKSHVPVPKDAVAVSRRIVQQLKVVPASNSQNQHKVLCFKKERQS